MNARAFSRRCSVGRAWQALLIASFLLLASAAGAAGLDSLEAFIKNSQSGRSEFTQVVTAPAREGQAPRVRTSSGTFEFLRPNRFRFVYRKPFEQTIVADGQTLWLFDADLNQVTARRQAQALGSTPAALITAQPSLAALQADFDLKALPDRDGMQWVEARPKTRDSQLQSVRVGLRGNELAALEITDSFGQRSVLSFSKVEINPRLSPELFQFKPPAGAAVVRQ
ncbi:MAG: outer membrane lipoprotein chaperone LolA [Burkholderiaceae bacterium]|nr:outer membrane lipoprotein chaperone LolA [Burkholderiaceae bacterium]